MRPPHARSDRSAPSSSADRTTPQRTTPRRDGAGRDRECVSNIFRTFSYQGLDIPALGNMREPVRDLYARHSVALAESATTFNRLLCGYEQMLTDPGSLQSDLTRTKEKLVLAERSLETMRVDDYRRQRDEARAAAAALETKVALMLKWAEIAEEKSLRFEGDLTAAEDRSREMAIKYEALLRLRDRELRVSSHEARKDVKSIGTSIVAQVRDHLLLLRKRNLMEREVAEIKANQDFLAGIQRGDYPDPEAEAASMAGDLLEVTNAPTPLEAIPLSSAPFDQFGSMTASLTVADALSLRVSGLPEESGPLAVEPAGGSQETALVEEETAQSGAGLSEGVEAEDQA
ncbi:unnamed protein product [Cochlearia groenlandica]